MRVTRARELVAEGYRPSAVARVAQISRQAIYRTPKPRRAPAAPARPPACEVEAAIIAEAEANPTDGYRMSAPGPGGGSGARSTASACCA